MKPSLRFAIELLLCGAVLISSTWLAFGAAAGPKTSSAGKPTPGLEAAKTLSLVTGVAISPLLGVGAVGAYQYWHASPDSRPHLSWFAQPWFFVPALLVVALVGLKDALGTTVPAAFKKPFDVVELLENKISALLVAGAFIPLVISVFPDAPGARNALGPFLSPAALGFATMSGGTVGNALLVPFAIIIFGIVWLASHAINVLILISPFSTVDAALKTFRLLILGVVAGASWVNPFAGALLCAVLIVVCYFIAGWSFRLTVFGTVYVWDFLTLRRRRFQPGATANAMFTARKILDVPVRTRGKLVRNEAGALTFRFRPWLVLKQRSIVIPAAQYFVGRGVMNSEIDQETNGRTASLFILPPRYRGHEEALARAYAFSGVQDVGLRKGFKAMWSWLKSFFGAKPAETPLSPAPAA